MFEYWKYKDITIFFNTFGFSNLREASEKEVGWKKIKKTNLNFRCIWIKN